MTTQTVFVDAKGEIKSWVSGRELEFIEGEEYEGCLVKKLDSFVDISSFRKVNYLFNGEWMPRDERPSLFHYWDNYSWNFNQESFSREVRQIRNSKLAECDWTQASDSPLTEAKKHEWKVYRQELRNLPDLLTNEITSLGDIVWPTPPA